ncbi:hypothetical protein CRE_08934 [Caenorhabditis remanei]|uniref:Serpentine Receptor, class U n=1 Tax=Caenorhabditis remanei TaxID=31234 RepID=E3LIC5_CAERE|nr:hypothetical protein CRE_08934 [Caenorhabditis remanei]
MNNETINGDIRYINYRFDLFTIPVLTTCLPLIYLIPTIFVIIKIFRVYVDSVMIKKNDAINPHVFFVIVLQLTLSFFYMLADYSTIRIPATGIITSWCASIQPNHFLKILYFSSVYFNYTAMMMPSLLSVLRVVPVYNPINLDSICQKIVRVSIPVIVLYPFLFCFPLIPAIGDCRQLLGTYQFGQIYFYWTGSWFGWRMAETLILNSIFWLATCLISNLILYKKIKKLQIKRESAKLRKAERSLTLITISMFPAYITNFILVFVFIFWPTASAYFLALRPYGSDCDFVFVPWIFYMTHPIFKQQKVTPLGAQRAGLERTNTII